jgi:hypothetical protein
MFELGSRKISRPPLQPPKTLRAGGCRTRARRDHTWSVSLQTASTTRIIVGPPDARSGSGTGCHERYFERHRLIEEKPFVIDGGLPMGAGRMVTKATSESNVFGKR